MVTFSVVPISLMVNACMSDVGRDARGAVIAGRALSTSVADEHHERGQEARGGPEADQGFKEERHGVTPKSKAWDLRLQSSLLLFVSHRCVSGLLRESRSNVSSPLS